jgi:hypothetical protein
LFSGIVASGSAEQGAELGRLFTALFQLGFDQLADKWDATATAGSGAARFGHGAGGRATFSDDFQDPAFADPATMANDHGHEESSTLKMTFNIRFKFGVVFGV